MNTLKKIAPIFIAFSLMALVLFAQNALFVNSTTGNVGVGTDDPDSNLHVVESSGDVTTKIQATDTASSANLVIQNDTTTWTIQVTGSDLKILDNSGTTRVTINSSGNVTLANNLTAANATVSGTVTANTIAPTNVSGDVEFTGDAEFNGSITPSRGIVRTHRTYLTSTTENAIYDDMKDYLPLDAYILVEGSISISNGPAGPSSGGSIYQIRKITNAVRLYYYDGLTHSYTYFQADDGGGGFGYEGANFIMVVW